jgi:hypothetical protein
MPVHCLTQSRICLPYSVKSFQLNLERSKSGQEPEDYYVDSAYFSGIEPQAP